MQTGLSVQENNIGQGDIIEQKETIAKKSMLLEKIEWLHENQLPSAAPAGLVIGEWWCPVTQTRQGTCHPQRAVLCL